MRLRRCAVCRPHAPCGRPSVHGGGGRSDGLGPKEGSGTPTSDPTRLGGPDPQGGVLTPIDIHKYVKVLLGTTCEQGKTGFHGSGAAEDVVRTASPRRSAPPPTPLHFMMLLEQDFTAGNSLSFGLLFTPQGVRKRVWPPTHPSRVGGPSGRKGGSCGGSETGVRKRKYKAFQKPNKKEGGVPRGPRIPIGGCDFDAGSDTMFEQPQRPARSPPTVFFWPFPPPPKNRAP